MDIHITVCVCVVEMGLQRARVWWELATTHTSVLCYAPCSVCKHDVQSAATYSTLPPSYSSLYSSHLIVWQVATQIV